MAKAMSSDHIGALCHTQLNVTSYEFKWTISNFSFCAKDRCLASSKFKFPENAEVETYWRLELSSEYYGKKRMLNLHLLSSPASEESINKFITVDAILSASNDKGQKVEVHNEEGKKFYSNKDTSGGEISIVKDGLLFQNRLAITCVMTAVNTKSTVCNESSLMSERNFGLYIENDLSDLLQSQHFSDVTLEVNGKEIPAHKAILAARSPVFSTMFNNDMNECQIHQLIVNQVISDMSYECVYEMIQFIYTGTVQSLPRLAGELLVAADKFQLNGLKLLCGTALLNDLSVGTAVHALICSDKHNLTDVKEKVVEFIKDKLEDVKKTCEWKMLSNEHPQLVIECFTL